jgi:hypothetical protein
VLEGRERRVPNKEPESGFGQRLLSGFIVILSVEHQ